MSEKKELKTNNKKKGPIIVLGITVVVFAIASIAFYFHYRASHIATDDAYVEGNIHTIASKVGGTVRTLHIKDNQFVKKGEPLLEIDPADYDVRVREATSAYESEKAKVVETEIRLDVAKKQIVQIKAAMETAKANRDLNDAGLRQAKIDMKRAEALLAKEAISKERYDKTKTALEVNEAQLKGASERIKELEASIEVQLGVIKQAQAGLGVQKTLVEVRRAAMDGALLNRGYTSITAPADGYITKRSVEIGNQISPGQPLCAIVPLEGIWVVANYKETQIEKLRGGQHVDITIDTYPGKTFHGVVDSIMAGTGASFSLFPPENATGNYVKVVQRVPVKILLDKDTDKDHILRVGMSVVPTIIVR
jgi:membrane fusion protein, multidrug efflux system